MTVETKVGRHQIKVSYRPDGKGADWSCTSCSTGAGGPKLDAERAIYDHLGIEYDSRVSVAVEAARDPEVAIAAARDGMLF